MDENTDSEEDSAESTYTDIKIGNRLSILHINCQSVKNKMEKLELEAENDDIVLLTETWLHKEITTEEITIDGFNTPVRKDREEDRYGGVAIYTRTERPQKERNDIQVLGVESAWIETIIKGTQILIGVIYRAPNEPAPYWDKLSELLEKAKDTNIANIIIAGDLNCNLLIPNSKLQSILDQYHLAQLIREPTHYTENNATLLDIMATTSSDLIEHTEVRPPSLSNHCDIAILMKIEKPKQEPYTRKIYDYKKANWIKIKHDLLNTNWEKVITSESIDIITDNWTKKYKEIIDNGIPNRLTKVRQSNAPWMTEKIFKLRKKKARKHKIAKRKNKKKHWENFKAAREKLDNEIATQKMKSEEELTKQIRNAKGSNEKLWWKLTKQFYSRTNNRNFASPPIIENGLPTKNNKEKATVFNNFFTEMSTLTINNPQPLPPYPDPPLKLINMRFTSTTVKEHLQNLNQNKASGPDGISPKMLRETATEIAPILARIYNFSMQTGTYPQRWKTAKVSPIHKKEDKTNVKNYRPISLLSIPGKVMERCVYDEMYKQLTRSNALSDLQAAYRPNSSTICQLIDIYNRIMIETDKGNELLSTFCDVSKAFDRVWHGGLLHKLSKAGIQGKLIVWLEDYLKHRTQYVVINGQASEETEITAGVPQGSIL